MHLHSTDCLRQHAAAAAAAVAVACRCPLASPVHQHRLRLCWLLMLPPSVAAAQPVRTRQGRQALLPQAALHRPAVAAAVAALPALVLSCCAWLVANCLKASILGTAWAGGATVQLHMRLRLRLVHARHTAQDRTCRPKGCPAASLHAVACLQFTPAQVAGTVCCHCSGHTTTAPQQPTAFP